MNRIEMKEKRAALRAVVETCLQAFDSRYTVKEEEQPETLDGVSNDIRVSLMGNPTRYADVRFAGFGSFDSPFVHRNIDFVPLQYPTLFEINVWQEVSYRNDSLFSDDRALWDDTFAGEDADSNLGLVRTIQELREYPSGIGVVERPLVADIAEAETYTVQLLQNSELYAAFGRILVQVT